MAVTALNRTPPEAGGPARRALVVSIINYKTADLTLACIASVLPEIDGIDAEIVVVDNLSGDGSAETIEAWIAARPDPCPVRLVRSATNSGFSGGHNQGMGACPAEAVLVLNSDAVLRPGCIKALLDAMAAEPEIGLFAPQLEYEDGEVQTSCFRFHGPTSELIRAAATGPLTRVFRRRDVPLDMPPARENIEWASFACILLRGQMVREIGPMDEGYFLYYEDSEYCLRARRAGWRIAYVPKARVVHYRGGSAPVKTLARARKRLPRYYYASRTRFLRQAHGYPGYLAANVLWYLGRGIQLVRRTAPPVEAEGRDIWIGAMTPLDQPAPR